MNFKLLHLKMKQNSMNQKDIGIIFILDIRDMEIRELQKDMYNLEQMVKLMKYYLRLIMISYWNTLNLLLERLQLLYSMVRWQELPSPLDLVHLYQMLIHSNCILKIHYQKKHKYIQWPDKLYNWLVHHNKLKIQFNLNLIDIKEQKNMHYLVG